MTEFETESSVLFKKIHGCLIGGLIGDAMGGPTEGMHYKDIQAKFGTITSLIEYKGRPAGYATDDSALKHMLCKAILRRGGRPSCVDWAEVWLEDMDLRMFIAPVVNSYNKMFVMGVQPREAGRGNHVSNSSAMCISPIGIIDACNPHLAALDAYDLSQLIHSGFPQDGASAIAAAVAQAFEPRTTVDSVIEAACAYLPKKSDVLVGINYALKLAREAGDYTTFRDRFYEGLEAEPGDPRADPRPVLPPETYYKTKRYKTDPRESVPAALAIFWLNQGEPKQTIIDCANFGRDSDTIGTMAGAIAGAFKGVQSFPPEWVDAVQRVNQPNQLELAGRLFKVILKMTRENEERIQTIKGLLHKQQ